jgi:hypothetical protein
MAPAEAERKREAQRRAKKQLAQHPVLAEVPEADREAVFAEANKYASRRWYLYAPVLILVGAIFLQNLGAGSFFASGFWGRSGLFLLTIGAILLTRVTAFRLRRFAIRTYVQRRAASRASGGADRAAPPSA